MQSKLGLGLAALGRPGYFNLGHAEDLGATNYSISAMQKHASSVLDAAWKLGIRYFDVARSYGRAEEFLATWIEAREIAPDQIFVGSKWGYTYTADWKVKTAAGVKHEVKRHELEVLQSQLQQTRDHLSQHLGLYQIHSATLESGVLENGEVLNCLRELKHSGVEVGLSVSGPQQAATIKKALAIKFAGLQLFDSVQATWNLLETSASEALQEAHSLGLRVIIKEALANGRLTNRNQSPEFAEKRDRLQAIAAEHDSSIDAVSIAAAMNQPWTTTVLSGAANVDHLRSNANADSIQWTPELQESVAGFVEIPEEYWTKRSQLEWN